MSRAARSGAVRGIEAAGWAIGSLVLCAAFALAALTWFGGPRKAVHAALAVYLVLVGALAGSAMLLPVLSDRFLSYNAYVYNFAIVGICAACYIAFVGQAVDVPLARVFRGRLSVALLAALGIAWGAVIFIGRESILDAGVRQRGDWWLFSPRPEHGLVFLVVTTAPFLFGIVASVWALVRAPRGSVARKQAGAYALVFVLQDATFIVANVVTLDARLAENYLFPITVATMIVFIGILGLLVRALLRWHLFDFDLKVKTGLRRGVVAAIALGAVLLAGQLAQSYLNQAYGLVAGAVMAALVLLALKPIERVAERVADAAMPRTTGTPEYVAYKKLEVYRAALESMLEEGRHDDALLARLREKLAIPVEDARAMEHDVRARFGVVGG